MKVIKQVTFRRSNYCGDSATKEQCSLYVGSYVIDVLFVLAIVDFGVFFCCLLLWIIAFVLHIFSSVDSLRRGLAPSLIR